MCGTYHPFGDTAEQNPAETGAAVGPDNDQVGRPASGFRHEDAGNALATGLEQLTSAVMPACRASVCACASIFLPMLVLFLSSPRN